MIKVSVLVPAYNHESYIAATLESLLAQREKNLEIIAVDDGATDSTGEILDYFAKRDQRVKVYHTENHGVASALNYAQERAVGEWIATCGSDDLVPPNAYRDMLARGKNVDVVIGNFIEITDQGRKTQVRLANRMGKDSFSMLFAMPATWNKLIRRDFLNCHGLCYPDVDICEDLILLSKIAACSPRCAFVRKNVYLYRNNSASSSMTHCYTEKFFTAHIAGREEVLKICTAAGIQEGFQYVYRDSLPYLIRHFQQMDQSALKKVMPRLKSFLESGAPWIEPEQIEKLLFLPLKQFLRIDAVEYCCLLRRLPPEDRVLNKFATGEIGLQFVWRCLGEWMAFKRKRSAEKG